MYISFINPTYNLTDLDVSALVEVLDNHKYVFTSMTGRQ